MALTAKQKYEAAYPKGRADLKNGICLCRKCHCKEHEGEPAEHLIKSKAGGKHGR